jgi:hypothetical protein
MGLFKAAGRQLAAQFAAAGAEGRGEAVTDLQGKSVWLKGDVVEYGEQRVPVAGARATVETTNRELFLTIEGTVEIIVAELDPKKGADARRLAAKINGLAKQAEA